jgi:ABC-2 type transport system ATP-binding protein
VEAILVDRLVKRFKAVEAVKGISFTVGEGEVFGFLGPNGAGKTTTINMLCTLLPPTSGSARVGGHDVVRERSAVRRSIGLVFQEPTLDEYLTAEENLKFHAYAYRLPRMEAEQRMRDLLGLVELWDRRGDRVRTFSGGMKRRLELARGLLTRPRVLFLDEPTLGLDPQTRRRMWDYILEMREREGMVIFLTTHYLDEAEHCDRVAIIDRGEVVALDAPKGLKEMVGGDVVSIAVDDADAAIPVLRQRFALDPAVRDGAVQFSVTRAEQFLPEFIRAFPLPLTSVEVHRPTLDDVFIKITGRAIREETPGVTTAQRVRARMRQR